MTGSSVRRVVVASALAVACVTGDPFAFSRADVAPVYYEELTSRDGGLIVSTMPPRTPGPPYSYGAYAVGMSGTIVFAVILDSAGVVDRRTLAVVSVSDMRLNEAACR